MSVHIEGDTARVGGTFRDLELTYYPDSGTLSVEIEGYTVEVDPDELIAATKVLRTTGDNRKRRERG